MQSKKIKLQLTKFQEVGLNKTNKIDQDKPEFYRLRSEKEVEKQAQQRQDRFDTRQNQEQIETLSASPKPNTSRLKIPKNISELETIFDSKSKMSQNGDTNLAEAINNLGDGFKDLSDTLKNAEKNRLKPAAYPFQKYSGREDPRSIDELQRQIGHLADMSEWDEAQVKKTFHHFWLQVPRLTRRFLAYQMKINNIFYRIQMTLTGVLYLSPFEKNWKIIRQQKKQESITVT
jgi:hypothetical protein